MNRLTLAQMITDLRAEIGDTIDEAQGKNKRPLLVRALQRTQRLLYQTLEWRLLKTDKQIRLAAGQRYYDAPDGIDIDRLTRVGYWWTGSEGDMARGIGPEEYAAHESRQTPFQGSFTITAGAAAAATGGFTINAGTLGSGNEITQISVNSVNLLSSAVAWGTSHTATAAAVVSAINNTTTTPNYTASNTGAAVTITADPDLGADANGYVVSVTVGGDVTVTSVSNMASGADNLVSSVKVDGLDLFDGAQIGWRTSNTATATAVAALITATYTVPNYTATAAGNRVVISSDPENSDSSEGLAVTVTVAGSVTAGTPVDMTGGTLSQRVDPPQRWDIKDVDGTPMIEVWPVPASGQARLELTGPRSLGALVADADTSTLDGDLIVLHAAAELVKDKQRKEHLVAAANTLRNAILKRGNAGGGRFNLTGHGDGGGRMRPGPVRAGYVEIPSSS